MSDPASALLDFIIQVLASTSEERGWLFYSVVTITIGIFIAAIWPFGGTPGDVLAGYGFVVVAVGSGVLLVKWFFRSIN